MIAAADCYKALQRLNIVPAQSLMFRDLITWVRLLLSRFDLFRSDEIVKCPNASRLLIHHALGVPPS